LINGEEKTGISVQYMDVGIDTGDIILQKEILIEKEENAGRLHDRLSVLGGNVLSRALTLFENGKPEGLPQDPDKATYCSKIDKSMGEIRWEEKASVIRNLVRGLTPWPGAYTFLRGDRLKVWKVMEWECFTNDIVPGTVLRADKHDGLIAACGEGALRIVELQGPGGRPMSDMDYLRGNPIGVGTCLGKQKI
jgi:methionyl-tRNA formyltransferase